MQFQLPKPTGLNDWQRNVFAEHGVVLPDLSRLQRARASKSSIAILTQLGAKRSDANATAT